MGISTLDGDSEMQKVVHENQMSILNQQQVTVCVFARTSSEGSKGDRQNADRQVHELQEFCQKRNWKITKVISSKISGSRKEGREDLKELLASARQGLFQKVILDETSRLGRVAKVIRNTISELHELKISVLFRNLGGGLESLDENGQETFVTNVIIALHSEVAQEEKRQLSERVKSGLHEARRRGVVLGRKRGTVKSKQKLLKEYSKVVCDIEKGVSLRKCQRIYSLSRNTVIKIKRAVFEERKAA